jgi:galactose mutarotase-like enzyme
MSAEPDSGARSITIGSPDGITTATFLPDANLVCSELRHADADWLDPVRAEEARATGKDYGVSLVHPWAGRLARYGYTAAGREVVLSEDDEQLPHDKQGLPIHGVWDRLLQWETESVSADRLTAVLDWSDERLLAVFPFPHELRTTASVGAGQLRVVTELRPTAEIEVPITYGYHAFLRIPESSRRGWTLRLGARERLRLADNQVPDGTTEPLASRAFALRDDDVNDDVGGFDLPANFGFDDGERSVSMELDGGFSVAHVWAPAGRDLVSFEPMTAPANALNSGHQLRTVAPGGVFRSTFTITLAR